MKKIITLFLALLFAVPMCVHTESLKALDAQSDSLNNGLKTCPTGYTSKYIKDAILDMPDSLFGKKSNVDYELWGNLYLATGTVLEKQREREYLVDFDGRTAIVIIPSYPKEGVDYTMPETGEQAVFYLLYFSADCFVLGPSDQYIDGVKEASASNKFSE